MWVIDKSFIDSEDGCLDGASYKPVEICGPSGWSPGIRAIYPFRMYDDDEILYYEGYCTAESFDPLDDFGCPNAGCTIIKYHNHRNREWETI